MAKKEAVACGKATEVYSRIVGYFRPVANWNKGKQQEFIDRKTYAVEK
ncbi:MAG: anaerobic ribonucleoside-triphosphate reductase [Candidatus Margulisbacteria bacterium]|jgi:ribonucleoside-triphosphate reductase|nr:anaerobic ribonucleoside-triphosphate reductase [Candidatus Margulisiibacteriota bacterium]